MPLPRPLRNDLLPRAHGPRGRQRDYTDHYLRNHHHPPFKIRKRLLYKLRQRLRKKLQQNTGEPLRVSKTSTEIHPAEQGPKITHFLRLPRELRDAIYEFALTDTDVIEVRPELTEPALLSVNRQIRDEARGIWLFANDWNVCVRRYDASLANAWARVLKGMAPRRRHRHNRSGSGSGSATPHVQLCVHSSCHWPNLLRQMRVVWAGEPTLPFRPPNAASSPVRETHAVLAFATRIAQEYRGKAWEECEATLLALKGMVLAFDAKWDERDY